MANGDDAETGPDLDLDKLLADCEADKAAMDALDEAAIALTNVLAASPRMASVLPTRYVRSERMAVGKKPLSAEMNFVRLATLQGASPTQIAATLWADDMADDEKLLQAKNRVYSRLTLLRKHGLLTPGCADIRLIDV